MTQLLEQSRVEGRVFHIVHDLDNTSENCEKPRRKRFRSQSLPMNDAVHTNCIWCFGFYFAWKPNLDPSMAGAPSVVIPTRLFQLKPCLSKNDDTAFITSVALIDVSRF